MQPGKSRAGVRNDTKHATAVERASRKLVQATSEADADIHLTEKEALTDAFSNNEASTQEIERIKIGSNRNCIREDLAKVEMVLSKESSRAIFEMGNVELIELKTSMIQCPSCLHNVFEGTLLCICGKLIKPNQDAIHRIKEALKILKSTFLPCISDFRRR